MHQKHFLKKKYMRKKMLNILKFTKCPVQLIHLGYLRLCFPLTGPFQIFLDTEVNLKKVIVMQIIPVPKNANCTPVSINQFYQFCTCL